MLQFLNRLHRYDGQPRYALEVAAVVAEQGQAVAQGRRAYQEVEVAYDVSAALRRRRSAAKVRQMLSSNDMTSMDARKPFTCCSYSSAEIAPNIPS